MKLLRLFLDEQKRSDSHRSDTDCDSDDGVDETQQRLLPSILRTHRDYHDNGGRYPSCHYVLTPAQKHHYHSADANQYCHTQNLKGKE
jgi:hypothetical protein